MTDRRPDPFDTLRNQTPPRPREAAKSAALAAARAAFSENSTTPAKGNRPARRLISILTSLKRISIMDMRLPIGTAALALLVLPLGWQLYSATALSPVPPSVSRPAPLPDSIAAETAAEAPAPAPEPVSESQVAPSELLRMPAPAAPMTSLIQSKEAVGGALLESSASALAPEPSGDQFANFEEQRLKVAAEEPVSTFSLDVDTASYAYVRRQLEDGFVPEPDAVRIEELINYFPYDYPAAPGADMPFKPTVKIFPTPWNDKTEIMAIGIRGYVPPAQAIPPSNLVFLIDTSGSMDEPDKLPLLKRAFALLLDQLSEKDTVSIVTYAGSAGVALAPTPAGEKAKILSALDALGAGGSTAGAEGIELAYRLAEEGRIEGNNRVILATDGDFNVGIADPEALKQFIAKKRQSGISLSVLGFGRGNLDDATMQTLAQNGNGNANYISSFAEAKKVLVEEVGGTLHTIAQDVKVQVEFNPAFVSEYRLIGYETRNLNREDFNNDAVDAGDVGAGHTVTALYEITPAGQGQVDPLRYGMDKAAQPTASDELAFLKIRYKLPGESVSRLIEQPVTQNLVQDDISAAGPDAQFATAVAAFGQKLRGSAYGANMSWAEIAALAQSARGRDESGYRAEFVSLVKDAAMLEPDTK